MISRQINIYFCPASFQPITFYALFAPNKCYFSFADEKSPEISDSLDKYLRMYTINIPSNPRIFKAILSRFNNSYLDVFDFRQCCEQKDFTLRFVISHLYQRKVPFTLNERESESNFS